MFKILNIKKWLKIKRINNEVKILDDKKKKIKL